MLFQSTILLCFYFVKTSFAQSAVQSCVISFQKLRFDVSDFDRYSEFYDQSSQLILAQAGIYTGPENIEEYVKFATDFSPFFRKFEVMDSEIKLTNFDSDRQTCTFLTASVVLYETDPTYAVDTSFKLVVMQKFIYDSKRRKVDRAYVFYTPDFISFYFNKVLNTKEARNFVCSTMKTSCKNIFKRNRLINIKHCEAKMKFLPITTNGNIRGLDFGCRALHSTFISKRPFHCPHISFKPILDEANEIKCQKNSQSNIEVSSLFDDEDLMFFKNFSKTRNIDSDRGFQIICKDSKSSTGRSFSHLSCEQLRQIHLCRVNNADISCPYSCNPFCKNHNLKSKKELGLKSIFEITIRK